MPGGVALSSTASGRCPLAPMTFWVAVYVLEYSKLPENGWSTDGFVGATLVWGEEFIFTARLVSESKYDRRIVYWLRCVIDSDVVSSGRCMNVSAVLEGKSKLVTVRGRSCGDVICWALTRLWLPRSATVAQSDSAGEMRAQVCGKLLEEASAYS